MRQSSLHTGFVTKVLNLSFSDGHGNPTYGDRLQNYGSARGTPAWLETGESMVPDAVYVLDAIVGGDLNDAASTFTAAQFIPKGAFSQFLKRNGLQGKRLGILRPYYAFHPKTISQLFVGHLETLSSIIQDSQFGYTIRVVCILLTKNLGKPIMPGQTEVRLSKLPSLFTL